MSLPGPRGDRTGPATGRWRDWPLLVPLAGSLLGVGVVADNHFRRGSALLTASVLLAFVLRLMLPTRLVGMLAVRSRFVDAVFLGGLAVALAVLTVIVPRPA